MKITSTHLFDVVEAPKSPHPTLKELMDFFKNVRPNLHFLRNNILLIFLLQMSGILTLFVSFVCTQLLGSWFGLVLWVVLQSNFLWTWSLLIVQWECLSTTTWMAFKCPLEMHLTNAIGSMFFQWLMICWMTTNVWFSCRVLMMHPPWNFFLLHGVIRFLS